MIPELAQQPVRPRLVDMAIDGLPIFNSTMLCGRAGTGKSSLAVEVTRSCGRPVAWYKVDSSDNEHRVFLNYLITTIGGQVPKLDLDALFDFCRQAHLGDLEFMAQMLVFQLIEADGEPLLIVIDDLHLIYDSPWVVPFFGRLLPLLPSRVHLLFAGRSLPPNPLWRMRSKQTLNVIDETMLGFTYAETARAIRTL